VRAGTATTDLTGWIQDGLNALATAGGDALYLPWGVYPVMALTVPGNVSLRGEGTRLSRCTGAAGYSSVTHSIRRVCASPKCTASPIMNHVPCKVQENAGFTMFGHLNGTVFEKHSNLVILETGGVGYEVHIPVSTFTRLPDTGSNAKLRIHTYIREDAILLYGFSTVEEKSIFEKLITVAGIGPKVALTALSSVAPADLVAAIRSSDITQLTRIPGVGKKTAERMVIELRDKFDGAVAGASRRTEVNAVPMLSDIDIDLISALVNLGSPRAAAEAAVRKARLTVAGENFEQLFRQAMEFIR